MARVSPVGHTNTQTRNDCGTELGERKGADGVGRRQGEEWVTRILYTYRKLSMDKLIKEGKLQVNKHDEYRCKQTFLT